MVNCMNSLQEEYLPACINSGTGLLSSDVRFAEPNITCLRRERAHEDHPLLLAAAPYFRENQSVFTHGLCAPNPLPMSSQKKLLAFYQRGTQTRLIHSPICPPITNPTSAATTLTSHFGLDKDEDAAKMDHTHQAKSILHDESAANNECGDGSEMHEDTEEINALLYSDDDYSKDSDEVRSTGHSPLVNIDQFEEFTEEVPSFKFPTKKQILPKMANLWSFDKHEQCEGITEDGSCSDKRQKLINGRYNRVESSYTLSKTHGGEMHFISSDRQARKESLSLRGTLKVLESIVPGTKGKDPLAVLDDAINYLNCLKLKATSLGVDSLLE